MKLIVQSSTGICDILGIFVFEIKSKFLRNLFGFQSEFYQIKLYFFKLINIEAFQNFMIELKKAITKYFKNFALKKYFF